MKSLKVNQGNIGAFLEAAEDWNDNDKVRAIIASEVHGFVLGQDDVDGFDIDPYQAESLRDLAIEFVDEGLFGPIPKPIESYLDYDAIARDLGMDYTEISIGGTRYIYRCD